MVTLKRILPIFAFLFSGCAGTRPNDLGVVNGKLKPCPSSPNCVSTFSTDREHGIEPFDFQSEPTVARQNLGHALGETYRSKIIEDRENYLHVEFTSAYFGFVDDVEFLIDAEHKVIHFRSASRIGKSDFGVNRKRMEILRTLFTEAEGVTP
jgi:uncharacterized protein (DUF1499 family)